MRLALAVAVVLALPASASAGTASLVLVPGACDIVCSKYAGQPPALPVFRYVAAAGEANAVTVSVSGQTVTLRDEGATVTPGDNCARADDHAVTCAVGQSAPTGYDVALDDGADSFAVASPIAGSVVVAGGAGDDRLTGGAEADTVDGGPGSDRLTTEAGGDRIIDSDAEPDTVDAGGDRDSLDLSARTTAAQVDLAAGTGPDGGTLVGVEDVSGGAGDDALTGDDGPNALSGGKGDDVLKGAGGADLLAGGPGRDRFAAGPGDDEISTRDGTPDSVACGDGRDKIRDYATGTPDSEYGETQDYVVGPDLGDVLDPDCELTIFGARRDVDGTFATAPPLRVGAHTLVLRTPCRCKGRVEARPFGAARFTARSRRVVVHSARVPTGVVRLHWFVGRRTGAWSVELPEPP